jgi:cytochrome c oxidase assembly protein subunit 15
MVLARIRPDWLSFRRFAAFTTALTTALVMLGVYTAATGSGLACSAQWPLCDNGLLPQTLPSFVEWFHRLVAMVTGLFILGTAGWAWTRPVDRRATFAATLAVVLLPLQISIGAVTVTLNGMLPGGYSPPTQAAHLLVALTIFTALTLTTLYAARGAFDRPPLRRTRSVLVLALGALLASALFSRVVPVVPYTPAAQAAFVGTSLSLFASLLAATVWVRRAGNQVAGYLTGTAMAAVFLVLLLGRDLVFYTPTVRTVNAALYLLSGGLVAAATWLASREVDRPETESRITG